MPSLSLKSNNSKALSKPLRSKPIKKAKKSQSTSNKNRPLDKYIESETCTSLPE
jgi:hypothetical protein